MKNKMTLQDLKNLFLPPSFHETPNRDGLTVRVTATKKKHRHNHNPSRKPISGKISPAVYRRRHYGKKK